LISSGAKTASPPNKPSVSVRLISRRSPVQLVLELQQRQAELEKRLRQLEQRVTP
jgi:hypothetical protein